MYQHPVFTRYPHLKAHPTDSQYSEWQRTFAFTPKKTLSGKRVWLKYIYKRQRRYLLKPFAEYSTQTQYATLDQVLARRLTGED